MDAYIWLGFALLGTLYGYLLGRMWFRRKLRKIWHGECRAECGNGAKADLQEIRNLIKVRLKATGSLLLEQELPGLAKSNWWKDWIIYDKAPSGMYSLDLVARYFGMKIMFVPIVDPNKEKGKEYKICAHCEHITKINKGIRSEMYCNKYLYVIDDSEQECIFEQRKRSVDTHNFLKIKE